MLLVLIACAFTLQWGDEWEKHSINDAFGFPVGS
jgi:hypothetical protein